MRMHKIFLIMFISIINVDNYMIKKKVTFVLHELIGIKSSEILKMEVSWVP